jgi:hypothetical protein
MNNFQKYFAGYNLFETNLNNQIFDKVKEERVPDVVS